MKSIIYILTAALSIPSSVAFVPIGPRTSFITKTSQMARFSTMTPELDSAIADVRACAAEFSEETSHFANGA